MDTGTMADQMTRRKRVIIESPYAGKSTWIWPFNRIGCWINRWMNVRYALACAKDSYERGEAPLASHLFYTRFLDDEKTDERRGGIESGFSWGESGELRAFYLDRGMSNGMSYGRAEAMRLGQPIEYRSLKKKEVKPL